MLDRATETEPTKAEGIAHVYRVPRGGNAWAALVRAVEDALTDLAEAERRSLRRDRLISHGYVRGRLDGNGR